MIVATLYGEQTVNDPDQHQYMWASMRIRLESADYSPEVDKMLDAYHAHKNETDHYKRALSYAKGEMDDKEVEDLSTKFNKKVVDSGNC